ncbi:hypothetical protein [Acidovorax sp.]|uniref:hypothetical protein n=1 Tax=Acidovorax sp. TaxID=1872122 RepID=UPI00391A5D9D
MQLDIRREFVLEIARQEKTKFDELLPKLIDLVSRVDALHAVGLMSCYGLMAVPNEKESKLTRARLEVQQGHIEFLQALGLRNHLHKGMQFPEPDSIQKIFDWLPPLFSAYQQMHAGTNPAPSEVSAGVPDANLAQVQAFLRAHTSVVRNWGYFGSVTRISRDLFSRIDADYERVAGMKLTKVVDVFEWLIRRHEDKANAHGKKFHNVFQEKTMQQIVDAFFAAFKFTGDVDVYRHGLSQPGMTKRHAMAALMPLADRHFGAECIVTDEEIAKENGLELEAVSILTNRLSLAPGDLSDAEPESFFLNNPVWLRPLVYMGKGSYFCALPQTLMSFIFPIADELLKPFERLPEKMSGARATYLEDEVVRLFASAFPEASFRRGFKWREGTQEFESDLVIRFDTTILLIEAKSGKVSWPALRGAPARLIEHVKKLIVEPSDQSGRLAMRIEEDISRLGNGETPLLNFPLSLQGATCVVRISVTLNDFATIQSVPGMLSEAGILKTSYPLAPCFSLADLDVMLDMLGSTYLRLHYLRRRAELALSLNTIGDELDTLGLYLDTSLNLGALAPKKSSIITAGYSQKIDRYYTARDEGLHARKPKPAASDWFIRLCQQALERNRPGWSEIACTLLSIAPVDQRDLEKRVRALAVRIRNGKKLKEGQDTIVLIPPPWLHQAVAVQVKCNDSAGPYGINAENIAQQAFEKKHVTRCMVLVVDALHSYLPYLSVSNCSATQGEAPNAVFLPINKEAGERRVVNETGI